MIEYKVRVYENRTEWRNQDGYLHRLGGPAVEYNNGCKSWWVDGKSHRLDGPAVEHEDGDREWWIDGEMYSEVDFNEKIKQINNSCEGRIVEIDGKKYKLVGI